MKKAFGRSELCTASCPDSASTGHPGAYQWYDERKKVWIWDFVGTGELGRNRRTKGYVNRRAKGYSKRAKAIVLSQANYTNSIPVGTRYRFVFVERWIHSRKPKGWRPVIRYVVEAKKERVLKWKCTK